jgi:hypothetical protein
VKTEELDEKTLREEFQAVVNMSVPELERWLETEESKSVGVTHEGEDESVGHQSGRRILEIKRKRVADLTKEDYEHMAKVIGFVNRQTAQWPKGDVSETRWRYSLMNWGHDPSRRP